MNTNENNNRFGQDTQDGKNREGNIVPDRNLSQKHPDGLLPEDDPAVINPDELATFPKQVYETDENVDLEAERENHSVNRKTSPERDGTPITRTDNTSTNDRGFL